MSEILGLVRGGGNEAVINIPVERIEPNPYQPRRMFEPAKMKELAQSIKTYGLLQPIILRRAGAGYQIVAGERRYQACRMLHQKDIKAIVRDINDSGMAALGLIENLQRENLSPIEEAQGYKKLIEEFHLTQEVLAQRLGKSQSTIANKIRILRLAEEVKGLVNRGLLTERHARSLLKLENEKEQLYMAEKAVKNNWKVKELEGKIKRKMAGFNNVSKKQPKKPIIKDIRIFLNTINQAIHTIEQAGLDLLVEEDDQENYFEVRIKLPKNPG